MKRVAGSLFAEIYLIFVLFIIPGIALYEGLKNFDENNRNNQIAEHARDLDKAKAALRNFADEERFYVELFSDLFLKSSQADQFTSGIEKLSVSLPLLQFAVYGNDDRHVADNFFAVTGKMLDWKRAGKNIRISVNENDHLLRAEALDELRGLIGDNPFIHYYGKRNFFMAKNLYQSDFFRDHYRYWFAYKPGLTVLARLPAEALQNNAGISVFAENLKRESIEIFVTGNGLTYSSGIPQSAARYAWSVLRKEPGIEHFDAGDRLVCLYKMDDRADILLARRIIKNAVRPGYVALLVVFAGIMSYMFFRRSKYFRGGIQNVSLFLQIAILMMVSAGIPVLVLGFAAVGYFNNRQVSLLNEKNQKMIEHIQIIDQKITGEYRRMTDNVIKAVDEIIPEKPEEVKAIDNSEFNRKFRDTAGRSSTSAYLKVVPPPGSGIEMPGLVSSTVSRNLDDALQREEYLNISVFADQHLASLNGTEPAPVPVERSYIIEMYFQKPLAMMVHDLLKAQGIVTSPGWGNTRFLMYVGAFSRFLHNIFDVYILAAFDANLVQSKMLTRNFANVLKNPHGFNVFAARGTWLLNEEDDLVKFPAINELFGRVLSHPAAEPQIVEFEGEKQLFVGLKGNQLDTISFCVLYPIRLIKEQINKEAAELVYFGLLAFSVIFSMILVLYLNLLLPVNRLHKAAQALEERDSTFRLPEGRGDEFADMARIFNSSIAEFEELQLAGIVQTRLLPASPLKVEGYDLYGKSLPMADLGGDYFDYFKIDDDRFVMLLGDVAGHGVGASLLMAMAKAGVICGQEVSACPSAMLSRLHQIILAIKNKVQRKVMTFQYLVFERKTGKMIYSNAGGCSPVIINSSEQTVRTVAHAGPVLGGFKKAVYTDLQLEIIPGEAVIFYTDGMVESRNEKDVELGYDGFYELFLKCYDPNAQIYYRNILSAWQTWLGASEAGDDVTLLILVRNNMRIEIADR